MSAKAGQNVGRSNCAKRLGNGGGSLAFHAGNFRMAVKLSAERHQFGDVGICQHLWVTVTCADCLG